MRRLDILGLGLLLLLVGGGVYGSLQVIGLDAQVAQTWASGLLLAGVVAWIGVYLSRVLTQRMTLQKQQTTYEMEILKQRLADMSPEELAAFQAELEADSEAELAAEAEIDLQSSEAPESRPPQSVES